MVWKRFLRYLHTGRGKKKYRHHVNPLSRKHTRIIDLPKNWLDVYCERTKPFHIDIGCATGEYIHELAKKHPERNFLGIDIRKPVIEDAERLHSGLSNLAFLCANFSVNMEVILTTLQQTNSLVDRITILHPDPWYKKCHHKRRLVQPEFVQNLSKFIKPDCKLYIQTDVEQLHNDMLATINAERELFRTVACENRPLISDVQTAREKQVLGHGDPVWRTKFIATEKCGSKIL
eukprot:g3468.t1